MQIHRLFLFWYGSGTKIKFEHSRCNFHDFIDSLSFCFLVYSNKQLTLMLILFSQFMLSLGSYDMESLEGDVINHIVVS